MTTEKSAEDLAGGVTSLSNLTTTTSAQTDERHCTGTAAPARRITNLPLKKLQKVHSQSDDTPRKVRLRRRVPICEQDACEESPCSDFSLAIPWLNETSQEESLACTAH